MTIKLTIAAAEIAPKMALIYSGFESKLYDNNIRDIDSLTELANLKELQLNKNQINVNKILTILFFFSRLAIFSVAIELI